MQYSVIKHQVYFDIQQYYQVQLLFNLDLLKKLSKAK